MNFLAHAHLSFGHPHILAGNMISDFVKGKKQFDFPEGIFKGIRLHRSIDMFTDAHPSTASIKEYFRKDYRLYAGAFADVAYDYFLANDKNEFAGNDELLSFTAETYGQLRQLYGLLPENFQQVFHHMQTNNWLYHYKSDWGIQKGFEGLARRAAYMSDSNKAFQIFLENKEAMQQHYDDFFPELKLHAIQTLEELNDQMRH